MFVTISLLLGPNYIAKSAQADVPTGVYYPLFKAPGLLWDDVISYRNAHPSLPWITTINPASGPGSSASSAYMQYVTKLKESNMMVLGYVSTLWAARSLTDAKADISKYKNWYDLDGVFFDEMSHLSGYENYYRDLTNYAKSLGMTYTIGNPGTDTNANYVGTVDNIMIAEGSGLPSMAKLGGWHIEYDKSNFSVVIHSQDTIDPSYVNNAKNYVSYMFITDDVQPNPYNTLPSHFDQLLSILDPDSSGGMHNLAVKSADMSGNTISGISITVTSGSNTVTKDFTPLTYVSIPDRSFTVIPSDNDQYTFSHWENGSTNRARTITLDSSKIMTAYFRTASSPTLPPIILINTITQNGAELNMWAIVESNGIAVKTGFTPLTVAGTPGNSYTITLSDYQENMFNHWENGNAENSRTIVFSGYAFMTGFYGSEPTQTTPKPSILTVNAVGPSGDIRHMWTSIQSGGSTLQTGYTPLSYTGTAGTSYTITIRDYQDRVFDHWENGSTSRTRVLILNAATTLTAYFKLNTSEPASTTHTITVNALSIDGTVRHMWTSIQSGGSTLQTGYTPLSYTGTAGTSYTITIRDYQDRVFDHWENGSTNRARTITLDSSKVMTAYFSAN